MRDLSPCRQLPDDLHDNERVVVWRQSDRAVGLVWLVPRVTGHTAVINGEGNVVAVDKSKEIHCLVGVELIWVMRRCRKQGIGLKMLKSALAGFEPGSVCFSQTTRDGSRLALRYLQGGLLYIYQ